MRQDLVDERIDLALQERLGTHGAGERSVDSPLGSLAVQRRADDIELVFDQFPVCTQGNQTSYVLERVRQKMARAKLGTRSLRRVYCWRSSSRP